MICESSQVCRDAVVVMLRGLSQEIVCSQLEKMGFRVSTSHSTTEGIHLANTIKPDLIIGSAIMDVLSGSDMLRCLSVLHNCQHIPSFLISSLSDTYLEFLNIPDLTTIVPYDRDLVQRLTDAIFDKFPITSV